MVKHSTHKAEFSTMYCKKQDSTPDSVGGGGLLPLPGLAVLAAPSLQNAHPQPFIHLLL